VASKEKTLLQRARCRTVFSLRHFDYGVHLAQSDCCLGKLTGRNVARSYVACCRCAVCIEAACLQSCVVQLGSTVQLRLRHSCLRVFRSAMQPSAHFSASRALVWQRFVRNVIAAWLQSAHLVKQQCDTSQYVCASVPHCVRDTVFAQYS
jgi:hypothetical protein